MSIAFIQQLRGAIMELETHEGSELSPEFAGKMRHCEVLVQRMMFDQTGGYAERMGILLRTQAVIHQHCENLPQDSELRRALDEMHARTQGRVALEERHVTVHARVQRILTKL